MLLDVYVSIYDVPMLFRFLSRTAHNVLQYVFAEAFFGGTFKKCSTHNALQQKRTEAHYVGGEAHY